MARKNRSSKAGFARAKARVTKTFLALTLAVIVYPVTTGMIGSIDPEYSEQELAVVNAPVLERNGDHLTIKGKVDDLFTSETFSLIANEAEAALDLLDTGMPDVMEVAESFDDARLYIASLRAVPDTPKIDLETRIAIAAVNPELMSSALDAINGIDKSIDPAPIAVPEQLAYARESTPATRFKTPVSAKLSQKEMWCLTTAVYFEARGESYEGQLAVAQVVMNRVNHTNYPSTVCGVVFQNQSMRNACQFSFACDGIPERVNDKNAWSIAERAAGEVVNGTNYLQNVSNATHYHATYVRPHWARRMDKVTKIGLHVFYRFKKGWTLG